MMNFEDSFFDEEERCGWKISSKQKEVWAVQLSMMKEFDRICQKYNLRWFAFFGTLLGAVRHGGYIPWDDDIDLAMPRQDYDRFLKIAKTEIKSPLFLQTTLTDTDCYIIHACIRNSDTTGGYEYNMRKRMNNGIGIDVVPLEGCEARLSRYRIRRLPVKVCSVLCNTYVNDVNQSLAARMLRNVLRSGAFRFDYKRLHQWIQKTISMHTWEMHPCVASTVLADYSLDRLVWRKEAFEEITMLDFEAMKIPVPAGYDHILRTTYGDYMQFPPQNKRGNKHDIIYEPDVPYQEYCAKHYGVKY